MTNSFVNMCVSKGTLGALGRQVSRSRAEAAHALLLAEEARLGQFVRTTSELEHLSPDSLSRRKLVGRALRETRIVPRHLQDALTAVRQAQHDEAEQKRKMREEVCECLSELESYQRRGSSIENQDFIFPPLSINSNTYFG